jgi:hypothetical protein
VDKSFKFFHKFNYASSILNGLLSAWFPTPRDGTTLAIRSIVRISFLSLSKNVEKLFGSQKYSWLSISQFKEDSTKLC